MDSEVSTINAMKQLKLTAEPKSQPTDPEQGSSKWMFKNKKEAVNETLYQNTLDPKCVVQINKRFVRIEYPGEVKNIDKAIETLGGIESIETSVADNNSKLPLHFHSRNKYNKPCFADRDFKPGLLIKVKRHSIQGEQGSSREEAQYEYEVEGVSVINFIFNKLCDFQYLPLVSKHPETKFSRTEYFYDKVLPPSLPTLNWFGGDDVQNMEQFLLPVRFSQYDSSRKKLDVESEKNEPKLKLKGISKISAKKQKSVCKIFGKVRQQISIFVSFNEENMVIPTEPLESAVKLVKHRNLEEKVKRVKQLFDERPIWTKAAIRYNTGISDEHSKIILPAVAYYFVNGPWRITWVKFGYDPRKDAKARIYQTLDYRIRTGESTKLKVGAKRSYAGKASSFAGPSDLKKISLKSDMSSKPKMELDERSYVLRPRTIPPARQMFYQLCDILLPEIQEMISQLPRSSGAYCHPRNGWLPDDFYERARKVVNDHVVKSVQRELLEDKKMLDEMESKEKEKKKDEGTHLDYYNQMLSNIKKGIYKNTRTQPLVLRDIERMEGSEMITVSSDEENEYTVDEIIQSSIPEKLDEDDDDDDEEDEDSDEAEIDMEAVQEINEMISQFHVKE